MSAKQLSGGRILVGEDSEEDEEEDEYEFQFNTFNKPSQTPTNVTKQVVISKHTEGEEDEDKEENDDLKEYVQKSSVDISIESKPVAQDTKEESKKEEPHYNEWKIDDSMDGIQIMADALVQKMKPSIDDSIYRIHELLENQKRLLALLQEENKSLDHSQNRQIIEIDITMSKVPRYIRKAQNIKCTMSEINQSVEKMKKRAEYLRVEAQSHAIKKENEREARSQWNKLYAAKTSTQTLSKDVLEAT